ncbi:MAG: heavy metal translocating P-type ATPase [Burkholderiales bacterium]|nr:heavy metal translocating P-type ATPase [Burkholderiales bacterium]
MSKHCCPPEPAARRTPGHAGHEPAAGHDHDHDHGDAGGSGHLHDHANLPGWPRLIAALAVAVAAELFHFLAPDTQAWHIAGMALAAVAIVLAGLGIYRSGLASLARGRLDINALMTVAVTGAFLIGQWPEAAMVMALYAIAELIEDKAADRARGAIAGLMALAPETADVQGADGAWTARPVADVQPGALVRVRPGGRIPLDGEVARGSSAVNQAPVTGESIPVDKAAGDPVFAGTISETGELLVRTTAVAGQSTLARIIAAVEQAQATRAPTQRFVDRFAAVYTPAVFAIALAVAVLGPFVAGWTWLDAIYKALVLLVIACPCALVISTPVTVVSGLTAAARRGILIKGGTFLESARKLRAVALDKTGTLTEGRPKLVTWQTWAGANEARARHAAASLAARSDHPVSRAIAQGLADEDEAAAALADIQDFQALAGRGSAGHIEGGEWVLGNHRLIEERGLCSPELEATLATHEAEGRTVTLLAGPQGVAAVFAVADTLRPTSREAIEELKSMGIVPVMLSGDNTATAQAVARAAGIDEAQGNLLPEDKQRVLADLQRRHGPTAMTGDGINDAPALAAADLGFAMGGAGTDIAMESADVVVMNDDLRRLPETVRLSRRTHAVLWQNISLALGIKAVFLVLALFGEATMWMAVFADMGASLLVVGNGLRLLRADVTR